MIGMEKEPPDLSKKNADWRELVYHIIELTQENPQKKNFIKRLLDKFKK